LQGFPVTDDRFYEDDPWDDWLRKYLLTRKDGLWLSDGMDWAPPGLIGILLEKGDDGLVLTGETSKILALAGLDAGVRKQVIVAGDWHSADHIHVRVSSAFVKPRKARAVAKRLIEKEPMHAWLPTYGGDLTGQDYQEDEKGDAIPWLVQPSGEARLDGDDPLGSIEAASAQAHSEDSVW
jgi:hypothetical protein